MLRLPEKVFMDDRGKYIWEGASPQDIKRMNINNDSLVELPNMITNLYVSTIWGSNNQRTYVTLQGEIGNYVFKFEVTAAEYLKMISTVNVYNGIIQGTYMLYFVKDSKQLVGTHTEEFLGLKEKIAQQPLKEQVAKAEKSKEKALMREKTKQAEKVLKYGDVVKLPNPYENKKAIYLGKRFYGYNKENKRRKTMDFFAKKEFIFLLIDEKHTKKVNRYTYYFTSVLDLDEIVILENSFNLNEELAWLLKGGVEPYKIAVRIKNEIRKNSNTYGRYRHTSELITLYSTLATLGDTKESVLDNYMNLYLDLNEKTVF